MLDQMGDGERYMQRLKHMADEQYYRQMREAALLILRSIRSSPLPNSERTRSVAARAGQCYNAPP
jgi:hypothetical protein